MLHVTCDCNPFSRAYLESTGYTNEDDSLIVTWDTDTMGLEYSDEEGLKIKCYKCGKVYDILRVN